MKDGTLRVLFNSYYLHIGCIASEDQFVEVLNTLLPESGYVYCPGISVEAYRDYFEVVRYHSKEVRCILEPPIECYEAAKCLLWHKPSYKKTAYCHPMHNSCNACKKVLQLFSLYTLGCYSFDVHLSIDTFSSQTCTVHLCVAGA